jgi:hypothetical protein
VLDEEFKGKSFEQNDAIIERLTSLEVTLGTMLQTIAANTDKVADTTESMAKDTRRPGPVRTFRTTPVHS